MSLIAKNEAGDYQLPEPGNSVGICYSIVDMGYQETNWGDKQKVCFTWELPSQLMDDGRPMSISSTYTLSLNEEANMRKALESWRSQKFTDEELGGFDLKKVLGKPCMLNIVHSPDGKYANIANYGVGVSPVPKEMREGIPPAQNELLWYDVDEHDQSVFDKLPKWLQKKISERRKPDSVSPVQAAADSGDFDDDIPF